MDNDYDLIHTVEVDIDLAGWTTSQVNGARLEVTAALNTITDLPWANSVANAYREARLRLTCVGYSVWSKGNV